MEILHVKALLSSEKVENELYSTCTSNELNILISLINLILMSVVGCSVWRCQSTAQFREGGKCCVHLQPPEYQ